MVNSMTGFARRESQQEWGSLVWEIRSLNHRYLELGLRLPEELRGLEAQVREKVGARLGRGKVELGLRFSRHPGALADMQLNRAQVQRVQNLYQEAAGLLGDTSALRTLDLLRWPGVVEEGEADLEPVQAQALELLDEALAELIEHRRREGASLAELIASRCDAIKNIVEQLREELPRIRQSLEERLRGRLAELDVQADPARLEQELVLQLQKIDVAEEMDRLTAHVDEVKAVLKRPEAIGRRLDFLMQEMNREANTLGSKSVAMATTGASVELKVLIEQMREQIQNIE